MHMLFHQHVIAESYNTYVAIAGAILICKFVLLLCILIHHAVFIHILLTFKYIIQITVQP